MDRPDDYDLYVKEGMQAEEARYYEEMQYLESRHKGDIEMREIKFRGIDKKGKFVYGDLVRLPTETGDYYNPPSLELTTYITNSYVLTHELVEADEDTIGQYTGFEDEKGKEIYEGDILEYIFEDMRDIGVVKMSDCGFWVVEVEVNDFDSLCDWLPDARITGNIYEEQDKDDWGI